VSLPAARPSHLAPTYLGWGAPPSVKEVAAGNVNDNDDGPTYDLGWGQPVDTPTVGDVVLAAKTINLDDGKARYLCNIHMLTLLIRRD
jgi:hypothetical protein